MTRRNRPRLTGNWLRKSDTKETIADAWPAIEKELSQEGFQFDLEDKTDLWIIVKSIGQYRGYKISCQLDCLEHFQRESWKYINEVIKPTILRSRSEFLRGIEKFDYRTLDYGGSLVVNPIGCDFYVEDFPLYYKKGDKCVRFIVSPNGKNFSGIQSYARLYHEGFIDRATDASMMIIRVDATDNGLEDKGLEKRLCGAYRSARRK